jgi:hypothetical protein
MPTLRSHTHLQAPQADTQSEACKRVCLPITQSDTKTFGQLVANLNIDKGCETRTTRTPACNI